MRTDRVGRLRDCIVAELDLAALNSLEVLRNPVSIMEVVAVFANIERDVKVQTDPCYQQCQHPRSEGHCPGNFVAACSLALAFAEGIRSRHAAGILRTHLGRSLSWLTGSFTQSNACLVFKFVWVVGFRPGVTCNWTTTTKFVLPASESLIPSPVVVIPSRHSMNYSTRKVLDLDVGTA